MTAASFRRLLKRPFTDHQALLSSSGPEMVAQAIGTGSRDAVENRLPSRRPAMTRRLATSGERNRVPGVEYGSQPNQERPAVAVTGNVAGRSRGRSQSRRIASAKEPAPSMSESTVGRRSATPRAGMRRKPVRAKGNTVAVVAAARRLRMAARSPSGTSIPKRSPCCPPRPQALPDKAHDEKCHGGNDEVLKPVDVLLDLVPVFTESPAQ